MDCSAKPGELFAVQLILPIKKARRIPAGFLLCFYEWSVYFEKMELPGVVSSFE